MKMTNWVADHSKAKRHDVNLAESHSPSSSMTFVFRRGDGKEICLHLTHLDKIILALKLLGRVPPLRVFEESDDAIEFTEAFFKLDKIAHKEKKE